MVSGARDGIGRMGKARSAAADYGKRRADLEPLARLLIDVLTLMAVLHRRSGKEALSRLSEEEKP